MVLLVVLEFLNPAERAVFLLHEASGYVHIDIADMLGRSPQTVRQLAHRGIKALLEIPAPDITLWIDDGGKGPATSLRPAHGHEAVTKLFATVGTNAPMDIHIRYRQVNGDPSALVFRAEAPFAVLVPDLVPNGELVWGVYSLTNPDKLIRISG